MTLSGCNHHCFHHDCIAEWFRAQREQKQDETCPLCRGPAENDYLTLINAPSTDSFAIIEHGRISYYHGKDRFLSEEVPRDLNDLVRDLHVNVAAEPLIIRRHSFLRMSSSLTCRADAPKETLNGLRYFLMSRYQTPRQRAMVLAGMTPTTMPMMLTEELTVYEPLESLKMYWQMPPPPAAPPSEE